MTDHVTFMAFELDGGVINAELIRQLMRNVVEK
jgi:hypothetical protein